LSERKITLPFLYERVNLYCAGVNFIFGKRNMIKDFLAIVPIEDYNMD